MYLHDTNSHRPFQREGRFLSHGCVRIPNAVELAELLLRDDPRWTREKIDEAIDLGKNRSITLTRPLPVHIVYDTAWVDESGAVELRKDIYGRDGEIAGGVDEVGAKRRPPMRQTLHGAAGASGTWRRISCILRSSGGRVGAGLS